jgi:predicted GNAT superfamily acetyltransferase
MIEVRNANKFDLPYFLSVVNRVHSLSHNNKFGVTLNEKYLNQLFMTVLMGRGTCHVAIVDDKQVGMVMGYIGNNVWSPETLVMYQILIYVEEEFRNTRAGYKLIKEYNDTVLDMMESKRIHFSTITASEPMFEMDFSRFGYELTEKMWVLGE